MPVRNVEFFDSSVIVVRAVMCIICDCVAGFLRHFLGLAGWRSLRFCFS